MKDKMNYIIIPYRTSLHDYFCSEACVQMLLLHHNVRITQDIIHNSGCKSFEGNSETNDIGIYEYLKQHIFETENKRLIKFNVKCFGDGDINKIFNVIDNNKPVLLRLRLENYHIILVLGYIKTNNFQYIIYHDSDIGDYKVIDIEDLYEVWTKKYIYVNVKAA